MPKLDAWWLKGHDARPGERMLWSARANRTQGARAVGGVLFLTSERLLFAPHLLDAALGGKPCAIELASVVAVDKHRKGANPLGGGMRDRLRVTSADGSEEMFVVNRLDAVIERLREAQEQPGRARA